MVTRKRTERESATPPEVHAGGIFKGLATLVERLGDLAAAGEEIAKKTEGELGGKEIKGVYGFSVKVGIGKEAGTFHVEPFGNMGRGDWGHGRGAPAEREVAVHEVREPIVDLFEEEKHTTIVLEMPGVGKDEVTVEVKDDIVTIAAERGEKKYRKEVLLTKPVSKKKMTIKSNNGVFEIEFKR